MPTIFGEGQITDGSLDAAADCAGRLNEVSQMEQ